MENRERIERKICPACGKDTFGWFVQEKMHYKVVKCHLCNAKFAFNPFAQKEYGKITDSRKPERLSLQNAMTNEALYIWDILDRTNWGTMIEKGKWLDIGCNIGVLLSYARKRGWDTKGVEISTDMAEHCRKERKLDVTGDINEVDGEYNLISLIDVLEQLLNPFETLKKLKKLLTQEGIIVITVPITPNGWFLNDTHINYFTQISLIEFFARLRLEMVNFQLHKNKYNMIVVLKKESVDEIPNRT